MTEATETGTSPLADLVRASRLPEPAERRRIRRTAGVSLRRVADEIGVSEMAVSAWERGEWNPSLENAAKYRTLLDELIKAAS